jgi:hypothetical protein
MSSAVLDTLQKSGSWERGKELAMAVDILKKFESHGTISVRLCAAGSIPVLGQPVISEGRFRLADEVPGRLAEEILATFLARGGYRVTPVGIERLFGQAKYLNQ